MGEGWKVVQRTARRVENLEVLEARSADIKKERTRSTPRITDKKSGGEA
jgi:hypothetical protein